MPQPTTEKVATATEWAVESMRATAFLGNDEVLNVAECFKHITGEEPDQAVRQPKMKIEQNEGTFLGRRLVIGTVPGRSDLLLQVPDELKDSVESESLGVLPDAIPVFMGAVAKWIGLLPETRRLAFGCTLMHPVGSRVEGYQWIQRFLPAVRLDPTGSRDFLFQINRPRPASAESGSAYINRLSKWSVGMRSHIKLSMTMPQGETEARSSAPKFAGRLELDLSTPNEMKVPLPPSSLIQTMEQLLAYGVEISERGDQP